MSLLKLLCPLVLVFLLACSKQEPQAPVPAAKETNSASLPTRKPIEFPRDEGVHTNSPVEWWYLNAHFTNTAGGKYSFAYCKFSTGRHLVIFFNKSADTLGAKDYYEQVDAAPDKLDLSSITGKWKQTGPSTYSFYYDFQALKLDLELKPRKKPFLPAGNGFVQMGEKGFSYYYAFTDVSLSGTVTMGTNVVQVSGKAWVDHQWGDWDWMKDFSQWKWYSIQLDNGVEMMLFNIYKDKKLINWYCGYIDAENNQTHRVASRLVTRRYYIDPAGGRWQNELDIEFPDMNGTKLTLTAERDDQFLEPQVLWEGSMRVEGTFKGAPVKGMAYGELNRPD